MLPQVTNCSQAALTTLGEASAAGAEVPLPCDTCVLPVHVGAALASETGSPCFCVPEHLSHNYVAAIRVAEANGILSLASSATCIYYVAGSRT